MSASRPGSRGIRAALDRAEARLARLADARRRWPVLTVTAAVLGGLALVTVLLGPVSAALTPLAGVATKDRSAALNATRQVLLAGIAGAFALGGLAFTARSFFLTRRGQIADRYAKAMSQLASERLVERVGGIYALEHLMHESDRNHTTVMEVLAAFVRDRTSTPPGAPGGGPPSATGRPPGAEPPEPTGAEPPEPTGAEAQGLPGGAGGGLPTDVRTALTVLGRRPRRPERHPLTLPGVVLPGAGLAGAFLATAELPGADLRDAELSEADLTDTNLMRADLRGALLRGATLAGALLTAADLSGADLSGADLRGAVLTSTALTGTILDDARLEGAVLTPPDATGLTARQLRSARLDGNTELPPGLGLS
ncbi:hypothetical protein Asp14428_79880 [Actinoplanes sp. NBRC 14428]|nr:hypothetical protein Asp14428_79880 [Actinoplanes sp. NBRC 14428]